MKINKKIIIIICVLLAIIIALIILLSFNNKDEYEGIGNGDSNVYDEETLLNMKLYDLFEKTVPNYSEYDLLEGERATLNLKILQSEYNLDISEFNNSEVSCNLENSNVILSKEDGKVMIYTNLDCKF